MIFLGFESISWRWGRIVDTANNSLTCMCNAIKFNTRKCLDMLHTKEPKSSSIIKGRISDITVSFGRFYLHDFALQMQLRSNFSPILCITQTPNEVVMGIRALPTIKTRIICVKMYSIIYSSP
jgi:hypothetical protein